MKLLIVLHRYAGIAIGVLMTLWCLSGFVMMYQGFPDLTQMERLRSLDVIIPPSPAALAAVPVDDAALVSEARIEMAAGAPVLRLQLLGAEPAVYDLRDGKPRSGFTAAECLRIARDFGRNAGIATPPRALGVIDHDQWTVATAASQRPVRHFAFDDRLGTEIYVSGATGAVFQQTLRRERILSWFGAVPHWLYPSLLRANVQAWSQVVIWTSLLGVFLTATGMVVGVAKIGSRRPGTISPYRGLWFWHHMTGLVFGILTLTWVFSGLLTMGPWGLLDSDTTAVREQYRGAASWGDTRAALAAVHPPGTVRVIAAPLAGELRVFALSGFGGARLAPDGSALPFSAAELRQALARARLPVSDIKLLEEEDAYYYSHHDEAPLPVYRVTLADPQQTRLYIGALPGQLLKVVDAQGRRSRWLQSALHDFDWPWIRKRPVWDLVVLPLLLGVTLACAVGAWLGFDRIRRDIQALRRKRRPRSPA